jgi:hypothetical protein
MRLPLQLVSLPFALLVFLYSSLLLTTATYMTATKTSSLVSHSYLASSIGWLHEIGGSSSSSSSSSSWALSSAAAAAAPTTAGLGQTPPLHQYRRLLEGIAAAEGASVVKHGGARRCVGGKMMWLQRQLVT